MNGINFYSENTYLYLPTSNNPKVALAIDDGKLTMNAFKLYNPFSVKAKFLKQVSRNLFTKFNSIAKMILPVENSVKSEFIIYLEEILEKDLISSVYFATAKDKVVLQLQSNKQIIGYLKFPLNELGLKHIKTEIRAIELLSERGIVAPAILIDLYKEAPYLLLKEIEGEIGHVTGTVLDNLIESFKKEKEASLIDHPRIIQIKELLRMNNLFDEFDLLSELCNESEKIYKVVFEHGDLAPWNIVNNGKDLIPFDFEYFEDNGLEYMDYLKFHFQTGHLLKQLSGVNLLRYIKKQCKAPEFTVIMAVFLIKEIARKKEENENDVLEQGLLKQVLSETI